MFRKFKYDNKPEYGKDIDLFDNGVGGVWWSAKDACRILEIEDADETIANIDPDDKTEALVLPDEDETTDPKVRKLPRKVVIINYRALFLLRSCTLLYVQGWELFLMKSISSST